MKEIEASISDLAEQPTADGSDDESDSEDEEEEEGGWSLVLCTRSLIMFLLFGLYIVACMSR